MVLVVGFLCTKNSLLCQLVGTLAVPRKNQNTQRAWNGWNAYWFVSHFRKVGIRLT